MVRRLRHRESAEAKVDGRGVVGASNHRRRRPPGALHAGKAIERRDYHQCAGHCAVHSMSTMAILPSILSSPRDP